MQTGSREGDTQLKREGRRRRIREGETPFDQLRLINGVGGGVVDGDRSWGWGLRGKTRSEKKSGKESVAMSETIGLCGFMLLKM